MSNSLTRLSAHTNIVADTADYNIIKRYKIKEATTNPSIILQTASLPQYKQHVQESVEYGLKTGNTLDEMIENSMDMINVSFGQKILEVTNKIHIQIDPRLAFNVVRSVNRALKLVGLFKERNIEKSRIVIKLPATWEGIQAAKILQNDYGVDCNMTTMFNLVQAAACAEAGVSCLAPFVGRIGMWYEKKSDKSPSNDIHPGVTTLKHIQSYMRKFGYETKVMGAYFLNSNEVKAISGCDIATLPIQLIEELIKSDDDMKDNIDTNFTIEKLDLTEDKFRWLMNEDMMATDLLSEVIRNFTADYIELERIVKNNLMNIQK
ncbi:unnamed protein product [Psylliodes chrysocephalus]|uniref:Transaldolase n=1 Tax=Psylliodes chrysocephalus TaxID=3402493 RepID=A0A9P0G939_9CUCU|nr:unnamed protein product [Psylliodes chrysocephala]